MGEVFRAERAGQPVALKIIRPREEGAGPALRREIAALARLCHPGVVRVVDHGVAEGSPWLAMEWLDGEDLALMLGKAPGAIAGRRPWSPGRT